MKKICVIGMLVGMGAAVLGFLGATLAFALHGVGVSIPSHSIQYGFFVEAVGFATLIAFGIPLGVKHVWAEVFPSPKQ